jgi:hypothetical protein
MAIRQDTDLRTALAQAFGDAFPVGSTLKIYTGTQPASANTAATGTLLATITLPASPWAAAASGSIAKNGTWSSTATGTGTAGYARLESGGKAFDMSIGSDLTISGAAITIGGAISVTSLTYTVPSGE